MGPPPRSCRVECAGEFFGRLLARISHEVWTGAMGGKSGARNFGSGRAGEVFRLLLVAGELWRAGTRRCAGTPRRLETARAVGSGRTGSFSSGVRTRPR